MHTTTNESHLPGSGCLHVIPLTRIARYVSPPSGRRAACSPKARQPPFPKAQDDVKVQNTISKVDDSTDDTPAALGESVPTMQPSDCMAPAAGEKAQSQPKALPSPTCTLLSTLVPLAPSEQGRKARSLLSSEGGSESPSEDGHSSPASPTLLSSTEAAAEIFQAAPTASHISDGAVATDGPGVATAALEGE